MTAPDTPATTTEQGSTAEEGPQAAPGVPGEPVDAAVADATSEDQVTHPVPATPQSDAGSATQAAPADSAATVTAPDTAAAVNAPAVNAPADAPPAPSAPAPSAPSVAASATPPAAVAPPVTPPANPDPNAELAATAATYGRVTEDGTVFVRTSAGEVSVGQYAAGTPAEGLAFFVRKYVDLRVEIDLALTRLRDGRASTQAVAALLARITEELATPKVVGDLTVLAAKSHELEAAVETRKAMDAERKARQRAESLGRREAIVIEAESLGGSTQWKSTGDRFKVLLDEWKALPRADRAKEQELWKRFSNARSAFDKARRTHFAKLDAERSAAKSVKGSIIEQAEALATSTDWVRTAQTYRDLMTQWKAAPRGSRADEDALWSRFRAAQDTFFAARTTALAARDSEFTANLEAKEALLVEAEALLPITDATDIKAFTSALRSIQSRWERIGHVPRGDKERIDGRLKAVENALRKHEQDSWRRSDPGARDRASGIVEQFRTSLAALEASHAKALTAGESAKATALAERIASTKELLAAAENAASEFRS
jgi:hypothetical protein